MVAKFTLSEHKTIIISALSRVDLRTAFNWVFKVNDQFPAEVLERRKELIPRLISERKKGGRQLWFGTKCMSIINWHNRDPEKGMMSVY